MEQYGKDIDLIKKVKLKDTSAQKVFYYRYVAMLNAVAARYVISQDELKDVVQNSFIRIFLSINQFEYHNPPMFKAWLTRIVVTESLKYLKEKSRFNFINQDDINNMDIIDDDEPDFDNIPTAELLEMIRKLPVGYRTIFNLYVFEKKSHKEIAQILNIKENTSSSQFHRAKSLLARFITNYKIQNEQ